MFCLVYRNSAIVSNWKICIMKENAKQCLSVKAMWKSYPLLKWIQSHLIHYFFIYWLYSQKLYFLKYRLLNKHHSRLNLAFQPHRLSSLSFTTHCSLNKSSEYFPHYIPYPAPYLLLPGQPLRLEVVIPVFQLSSYTVLPELSCIHLVVLQPWPTQEHQ